MGTMTIKVPSTTETRRGECRFLYLVGQLRAGGSERQLFYLLQTMDRQRYRPAVVVWNIDGGDTYVPRIQALGVPIHSLRRNCSATARLSEFRRLVARLEPEVVHSFSFHTNFAASWGAIGTRAIAVGGIRGEFQRARNETGRCLGRLSGRWPRTQIANSQVTAASLQSSRDPFTPRKLFVVRNGLDLQHFDVARLPPTRPSSIVGIGSLFPVKRWDRLVAAAAELKRRGFDFSVRIVGDGPLRDTLRIQAQHLGAVDCVEFLAYRDDIPALLADATFLVHTSDSEGCPNAVMEAMACGRAVVATDAGDVPHLLEDGKTGFVVRRGDDAMLVERIVTLMRNPELCLRMGRAARAKAQREFGLVQMVRQTVAVYHSIGWSDSWDRFEPKARRVGDGYNWAE